MKITDDPIVIQEGTKWWEPLHEIKLDNKSRMYTYALTALEGILYALQIEHKSQTSTSTGVHANE